MLRKIPNILTIGRIIIVPFFVLAFYLPGFLGDLERIFRRRFIETHELLGRGKVLTSYENNKLDYIRSIAKSRLSDIEQKMLIKNSNTYIDVSKYFARGLHTGYLSLLKDVSVINLVRDPISNMKSFINSEGPSFLEVKIQPGSRADLGRPTVTPIDNKKNFMKFLEMLEIFATI